MVKRLLSAIVCVAILTSCEKEITSLEGTYWKGVGVGTEILFGATHATITESTGRENPNIFTGRYTYDPPSIVISGYVWDFEGNWIKFNNEVRHVGTVNGSTMEIGIASFDMIAITTLERQ